jgi:iron complex transport system substrate-binding protein
MPMIKILLPFLALALIWGGLLTPPPGRAAEPPRPIVVTDFRGKTLRFEAPVRRIVCLIESALSGIYMLGEEQRVVGLSRNIYTDKVYSYYAALDARIKDKKLPTPGNWDFVNLESVVALKPDLVILWSQQTEAISSLEEKGIPVYGVFIQRKEDVYKEIEALGKLTGNTKRAEALIRFTKNELARFASRTSGIPTDKRPGVYYMWAQGNLETSCGESTVNDLIQLAGGRNVCAALPQEHLVVNLEKVFSWDPDLILMWYNEKKGPLDIIQDPQWKRIKAVRDRRVHEFPEVFWCDLWTLKFLYAVKLTAKWVHPELFRDIDLDREKQKMLDFFYRKKSTG